MSFENLGPVELNLSSPRWTWGLGLGLGGLERSRPSPPPPAVGLIPQFIQGCLGRGPRYVKLVWSENRDQFWTNFVFLASAWDQRWPLMATATINCHLRVRDAGIRRWHHPQKTLMAIFSMLSSFKFPTDRFSIRYIFATSSCKFCLGAALEIEWI